MATPKLIPTTLHGVYFADALHSNSPVPRRWSTLTYRNNSLAITESDSHQAAFGAEATAGYLAGDKVVFTGP
jgi:hypothetical protein